MYFNKVPHAHAQQRARHMPFEAPGVVIDHTGRNLALRFTNGPVHHFPPLFTAANGNGYIRRECPASVFAWKLRFRPEHKLTLSLFFPFLLLTRQGLSKEKAQTVNENQGDSNDQ